MKIWYCASRSSSVNLLSCRTTGNCLAWFLRETFVGREVYVAHVFIFMNRSEVGPAMSTSCTLNCCDRRKLTRNYNNWSNLKESWSDWMNLRWLLKAVTLQLPEWTEQTDSLLATSFSSLSLLPWIPNCSSLSTKSLPSSASISFLRHHITCPSVALFGWERSQLLLEPS